MGRKDQPPNVFENYFCQKPNAPKGMSVEPETRDSRGNYDQSRATVLRLRIKQAGLTIAEFQRRSGLTRNVVYALAKGKKPSVDQERRINETLPKAQR